MFDMKAIRLNWSTMHISSFHGKVGENNDTARHHTANNNNKDITFTTITTTTKTS